MERGAESRTDSLGEEAQLQKPHGFSRRRSFVEGVPEAVLESFDKSPLICSAPNSPERFEGLIIEFKVPSSGAVQ